MSQTAIPLEFERYLQNQISLGDAPDMNEMIFAYIPGLDASQPIDRSDGLPDVSLWVHQQDIDQVGKLGDNALAYSVVIPGTVAEFTFNAIYLRDKNVPNSCGMVVHKAEETKENGMASTKSLVQAYAGAAEIAGIPVDAATWQIDYQARLNGMEEDHRLACLDNYGHTAFVEGFDVTQQADPNKYQVTPGIVYVGGLRGVLEGVVTQTITTKPNGLYVDVVRQGTALSVWENIVTITASETELTDYVDGNGDQHYVAKLAGINADGSVVDWRVKGGLDKVLEEENPFPQYPLAAIGQDLPYDPNRTYKQNESCVGFDDVTGEMTRYISYYPGDNKGHDPQDPANRHEAWPNFPTPCWWIKAHGLEPGTPTYWLSNDIPENAMQVMDLDIDATFYHRIAKAHPSLVVDGKLNLATVHDRFIRIADGVNHLINTTHEDAFQGHGHFANNTFGGGGSSGGNGPVSTTYNRWTNATANEGLHDKGYGTPRIADETRPKAVMQSYIIWM